MRRIFVLIALLALTAVPAAGQAAKPERGPGQPYFVMHVKDCTLPMCEEQVVYLRADGRMKIFTPQEGHPKVPNLAKPGDSWEHAKPQAFLKVQRLVPALAKKFPAEAKCEKVRDQRLLVTGRLVQAGTVSAFRFSDACADESTASKSYQLIRQLREAVQLGVQPLAEG